MDKRTTNVCTVFLLDFLRLSLWVKKTLKIDLGSKSVALASQKAILNQSFKQKKLR